MSEPSPYIIVQSDNAFDLAQLVSKRIAEGYKPSGSLVYGHCCRHNSDPARQHYYAQPMVLEAREEAPQ
jgi:hypothetical protein